MGVDGNRFIYHSDGSFVPSRLIGNHSEQVSAIGMVGNDGQNLTIDSFSFVQTPGHTIFTGIGICGFSLIHLRFRRATPSDGKTNVPLKNG